MVSISKSCTDSKQTKAISNVFNSEVGKTYNFSRLMKLKNLNGNQVIADGDIPPASHYFLRIGLSQLSVPMTDPSDGKFTFPPALFEKSSPDDNSTLFKSDKSTFFQANVRKGLVNRLFASDKNSHLRLDLKYSEKVSVDTNSKEICQVLNVEVTGASKR